MNQEEAKFDVSVIMPALNEEENISGTLSNTLKAFDDLKINGEIIVVDDGSKDKTAQAIRDFMDKNSCIRMISHQTSEGIGASFWDGVDDAKGSCVIMLPGDNENDPWEILRYYNLLEHVDIVIPFIYNREVRPALRNILSLIYRTIINTTFMVNLNYTNGTVIYRKTLLNKLDSRNNSFFFQTDILIKLVRQGYLFAEVPYRLGIRCHGVSKAISFPSFIKVIKGYLHLFKDLYYKKNKKGSNLPPEDSLTFIRKRAVR